MRIIVKALWVLSWMFCIGWAFHIRQQIGMDAIMPMKFKLPLVLSLFGPVIIWLAWGIYYDTRSRKNEPIENKFDINR